LVATDAGAMAMWTVVGRIRPRASFTGWPVKLMPGRESILGQA
jgi:hypothetical protein